VELEAEGSWLTVLELLAEVKLLRLDISQGARESATRACAAGDQWERALDMLGGLEAPAAATVAAVVAAVGQVRDAAAMSRLLAAVGPLLPEADRLYGAIARHAARAGLLQEAYDITERLIRAETYIEESTFSTLALELVKAGEADMAEEVLEWKDYLAVGWDE